MTRSHRLTGPIIRIAALTVAAALLALLTWQSLRLAARDAAHQELAATMTDVGAAVARQTREIDLAAMRALRAIERSGGFEPALDPVLEALSAPTDARAPATPSAALSRALTLRLVGAAEFRLRGGDARLRRSYASPGPDQRSDADMMAAAKALRAEAITIARQVAGLGDGGAQRRERAFLIAAPPADADGPGGLALDPRMGAPGAARFWAARASPGRGVALALLFEAPTASIARDGVALHATLRARSDRVSAAAAIGAEMDAPLAGGALTLRLETDAPLLASSALKTATLALICSILIGAAIAIHVETGRVRASELDQRNRAILRKIDAKQRALEQSEERFRHLAESANVVPWTADLEQQRFTYVGPQIEALSGYDPQSWMASGFWPQHIHPVDRSETLRQAVELTAGGNYATIDYRIRAADGRVRHVRNMLTVETADDAGEGRRRIARGFMLDVTELRQAAAALEVARRKAEEANRVKSEFLANMSHELRTPLNAVIGFSEIMKDEIFGPLDARYREYAASVHASGRHLLDLINDVLDLSKIEAGRIELVEEPNDIGALLQECRTLLQEQIATGGLHDSIEVEADLPPVLIDERRIKQVVLNLMSNAIKFTPPGGAIRLAARRQEGRGVRIVVRDTGIGMAPHEVPRALAKFGQIDGELARKHDGTGLGLPIAKSLIEMHGGALEIWSEKGKGTEMRILLPESRLARRPAVAEA